MTTINMSDKDKEQWRPVLEDYYRGKGLSEADIAKKIDALFAECQLGWNRAPRDLDTRIKMKSGFQWKSHSNLKPNKADFTPSTKVEDDDDILEMSLFDTMSASEKNWWEERSIIYNTDFEFNTSSDKPLMDQLLVEELMQRRLFKLQLRYKDKDYSKRLTDSMKRVTELQTKLGITREQRAGIMNKIDGNVAQLAVSLDEKLNNMPEIMKKEYEEEVYYSSLRDQRPPINLLPPVEKIEALLNVDGEVSANLDSSKISEISEEVAKEVTEQREVDREKAKILPELADGESI